MSGKALAAGLLAKEKPVASANPLPRNWTPIDRTILNYAEANHDCEKEEK